MTATTERILTDRELMTTGFQVLVDTFGNVNAEWFITLTVREPEDYTLWREKNMYVGESLHEVAERARASGHGKCCVVALLHQRSHRFLAESPPPALRTGM